MWRKHQFLGFTLVLTDPQKAASEQAMLADLFCVKITDIFDQKNTFSNFGAIQGNFTIWNNEKEPTVIKG